MDPLFGRVATFLNLLIYVLIRWPHGNRIKTVTKNENRHTPLETVLLTGATLGTTLIPIIWVCSSLFIFADYPLHPVPFGLGVCIALVGHWVFYRSHADLATNWFPTLHMREGHELVTTGVYARVRHPMYLAMILQGIGQTLFLPNWLVGPAWLVSFGLVYLLRVGPEEQMVLDRFGEEYEEYMDRTPRLIPSVRRPASSGETLADRAADE